MTIESIAGVLRYSSCVRTSIVSLILCAASVVHADPLSSTDFSLDYSDIASVSRAQAQRVTPSVMVDLSNPNISNDIRAAIVNALGWAANHQNHALQYANYLAQQRGVLLVGLRADMIAPHELFALGYMAAMDSHADLRPLSALAIAGDLGQMSPGQVIDRALRAMPNDFSVLLVRALVRAQELLLAGADRNSCRAYQEVIGVIQRQPSTLRPNAVARIAGYMETFHASCPVNTGRGRPRRRR
jgi:hypothetical protein